MNTTLKKAEKWAKKKKIWEKSVEQWEIRNQDYNYRKFLAKASFLKM